MTLSTYTIKVKTGDVSDAGTDANVFVTLFGDQRDSTEIELRSSDHFNKFERNQWDTFQGMRTDDVGFVTKVRIRHDNAGIAPGWFLDTIEVHKEGTPSFVWAFPCQAWLAKDEGDGKIDRILDADPPVDLTPSATQTNLTEHVVGIQPVVKDDTGSDSPLAVGETISRSLTQGFTLQTTESLSVSVNTKVDLDVAEIVKAVEISSAITAQISTQFSTKFEETISVQVKIEDTVPPRTARTYLILWKQTLREGEATRGSIHVPFQDYFDDSADFAQVDGLVSNERIASAAQAVLNAPVNGKPAKEIAGAILSQAMQPLLQVAVDPAMIHAGVPVTVTVRTKDATTGKDVPGNLTLNNYTAPDSATGSQKPVIGHFPTNAPFQTTFYPLEISIEGPRPHIIRRVPAGTVTASGYPDQAVSFPLSP